MCISQDKGCRGTPSRCIARCFISLQESQDLVTSGQAIVTLIHALRCREGLLYNPEWVWESIKVQQKLIYFRVHWIFFLFPSQPLEYVVSKDVWNEPMKRIIVCKAQALQLHTVITVTIFSSLSQV